MRKLQIFEQQACPFQEIITHF